jgi:hypothetical protein
MSHLPPFVMHAPRLLYSAAIFFFVWSLGLTWIELDSTMGYAGPDNAVVRLAFARALFQAALEAVYIAANGVVVHVLLAIWARGRAADPRGDEE